MKSCHCTLPYTNPEACKTCGNRNECIYSYNNFDKKVEDPYSINANKKIKKVSIVTEYEDGNQETKTFEY